MVFAANQASIRYMCGEEGSLQFLVSNFVKREDFLFTHPPLKKEFSLQYAY